MTDTEPLTLRGIADMLGVSFWRVRRWRENQLKSRPQARKLPDPDVSTLDKNPLWSRPLIKNFAMGEGLWPPAVDQYRCSECGGTFSIYDNGTVRPHGWQPKPESDGEGDGKLYECAGSSRPHVGRAKGKIKAKKLAGAAA
jgi:hypothetical protein